MLIEIAYTCLIPSFFIEVLVLSQESERLCIEFVYFYDFSFEFWTCTHCDIFSPFIIGYGGRRGRGRDRMVVGFTTISAYHN